MAESAATAKSTEEYDRNVDEELLDVISHDSIERQQQIFALMAQSVPVVTIARRVYSVLFPVMEANNRKSG